MQFDNVFETDSKLTCDAFHATRDDTSKFRYIITSCRYLFSYFFTNFMVEFVRRQANRIAHALGGEVMLLGSLVVYFMDKYVFSPYILRPFEEYFLHFIKCF